LCGTPDLAHARLGAGERPLRLWRWIGVALIVSALTDVVIPVLLALARIARRMAVPAKALSGAINRVRGENVSRVVNGWRIAEACTLMRGGASVTEAMLGAGFNTKSNFNREFLRVIGKAPKDWLRSGA
jgi:AraC-like DNA-binding protein